MTCVDLAVEPLRVGQVREAELIAFYLPMHTATRLAVTAMERVRGLNPEARLCCYGLYAAMNESYLRGLGVEWGRSPTCPIVSQEKQKFRTPDLGQGFQWRKEDDLIPIPTQPPGLSGVC